jgi:PKD repeat protein
MRIRLALIAAAVAILAATTSPATTIVLRTDDQLVDASPVVVRGTVVRSEPVERNGGIWTETELAVERVLKGEVSGPTVTIREVGGRIGDRISVVFGSPAYLAGERVLVFLWPTPRGDYQTRDLFTGKFTERTTRSGRRVWHRSLEREKTSILGSDFEPFAGDRGARDAALFEEYVSSRAKGRAAKPDYIVTEDGGGAVSSEFTLISEPTIYRWFAFDDGSSASWYSYGTQSGYAGGGVNEIKTAVAPWSGYAEAKIRYVYAGAGSGSAGGLSRRNGINEVILGDVLNEIDGTWDGSGGVVGRGGFNHVGSARQWTAPFTADATHTAGAKTAWPILEGNLVIQDGVSPSTGISSSRLAEIIAHEFGHTLGFGHSDDSSALMYYRVTGLGPSLRADDQLSARWLYPAGTTTVTVPAAPTNLAGSVSGNEIRLTWKDNASNETAYSVWVATGSGSFSRAGDVGANATAATLTVSYGQTYRIYVTARNGAGDSAPSNTIELAVTSPAAVSASFTVSAPSGTAGVTRFYFTDTSTGAVSTRSWSFGDGATSTSTSPSHVYGAGGTYTVSLTVYGSGGAQSTAQKTLFVGAATSLTARFSYTPEAPSTADTVSFRDESTGGAATWNWAFGDGTFSSQQNPSKGYVSPGSYNVTLRVSGGGKIDETSRTIVVAAANPAGPVITADFTFSPLQPGAGEPVSFTDQSSGGASAWSWDFGDGNRSTLRNPVHAWAAPGDYRVTLTASHGGTSSVRVKNVIVAATSQHFRTLVPVAAQTSGAHGTEWRTELTIANGGTRGAGVTLRYVPTIGGNEAVREAVIPAGSSQTWHNALRDLFALTSGSGGIRIESSDPLGAPFLIVSSRTFTGGLDGTYGQQVPADSDATSVETWLTGLESGTAFRTNLGFVNETPGHASLELTLSAADGTVVGRNTIGAPPRSLQQMPLGHLFPLLGEAPRSGLSLAIRSTAPGVRTYASVVDNRTQDPVYIPATRLFEAQELLVAAVARTAGGGGTFWRSDLTIFNPHAAAIAVDLRYLAAGADNRWAPAKRVTVAAGRSVAIADVVTWMGGTGSGALMLVWYGGAPVVTSRTYTERASDGGTFGQSIPAAAFTSLGGSAWVTGLKSDGSFRSNVGLVNTTDRVMGVSVELVSAAGHTLATAHATLQPKSQLQYPLGSLFTSIDVSSLGNVNVRARSDAAWGLALYGSVVDNVSGDPVYLGGVAEPRR